jgi:hypothetical protein
MMFLQRATAAAKFTSQHDQAPGFLHLNPPSAAAPLIEGTKTHKDTDNFY